MQLKAQLVHIVNTKIDSHITKNDAIDLIFKVAAHPTKFLCVSLDPSHLSQVSYELNEIHVFTPQASSSFRQGNLSMDNQFSTIHTGKTWQISIQRLNKIQYMIGSIVTPIPRKLQRLVERKYMN